MKKFLFIIVFIINTFLIFSQVRFKYQGNPLVRHLFTADPTARVFNGRLYVYTSHDKSGADYYTMEDWHVFSTDNMVDWVDHGAFFSLNDIPWATTMAWAPDCVERNKKYYLYYPVERTKIGVAVSDNPVTGFQDSGKPLIDNRGKLDLVGPEPIDPTVIVYKDQAYMFFGCRQFRYVKLKINMIEVESEVKRVDLRGNETDKQNFGGYYGEGPFIFQRGDLFYMIYSNGWGSTSTLVYATAKTPDGPFKYQGPLIDNVGCGTSHGSVVEFKGQWYLFYHTQDLSNKPHRRSVCFDKLYFDKDGKIQKVIKTTSALSKGENYYKGKGRIALSSDGNMHDNDDMQATMLSLMILAKANLQDKTSVYIYADHVWGSENNDLEIIKKSAEECGAKLGFNKTQFIAAVIDPERAYEAMKNEILKSNEDNPLFIVAAGPMQVIGEAIDRAYKVDANALNYVTVISHSEWNNQHADKPMTKDNIHSNAEPVHNGWTWSKMKAKYSERINFNYISDQNGTGDNPYKSRNKFSAPSWVSWDWMRTNSDSCVRWIYTTARINPCGPDFSDAGMLYYLCADLDGKRGDENGNPEKLHQWIDQQNLK